MMQESFSAQQTNENASPVGPFDVMFATRFDFNESVWTQNTPQLQGNARSFRFV